jgi:TatD DNase family protein
MIDTHCHIDLYPNPIQVAQECELAGLITIGMTNIPSHFEVGFKHLAGFKNVRLALGMHPLNLESVVKEWPIFLENVNKTSYIGEIGLDFSKEGIATKEIQINVFKKILSSSAPQTKMYSLHSRRAEREVLNELLHYKIKAAIFHWYSGPTTLIDEIVKSGYYFSINTSMIESKSGREIINRIPKNRILTESDGPFVSHNGKNATPFSVKIVEKYLSNQWGESHDRTSQIIRSNFFRLISLLK